MKSSFPRIQVFTSVILLLFSSLNLAAQESNLKFKPDNSFKIVQFTDMHFYKGGKRSQEVLDNIKSAMDAEKPDLVILLETGKVTFTTWLRRVDGEILLKVDLTAGSRP